MNKTAMLVVSAGAFVAVGCASAGPIREEARDVAPFTEVILLGNYTVEVRVGGAHEVVLRGAAKDLDVIETDVSDGTLVIKKKRRSEPREVNVVIGVETLRKLVARGSIDGEVSGVGGNDFDLLLAGSVDLEAAGTCGDAVLEMAGSIDLDAEMLVCDRMDIDMAGSTDAAVHVTEEVTMNIAGSGRLDVYGDPARVIPGRLAGSVSVDLK